MNDAAQGGVTVGWPIGLLLCLYSLLAWFEIGSWSTLDDQRRLAGLIVCRWRHQQRSKVVEWQPIGWFVPKSNTKGHGLATRPSGFFFFFLFLMHIHT